MASYKIKIPKLRFPEFCEEWNKSTLGQVATFSNGKAHEKYIDWDGEYIVVNSKFISTGWKKRKFCDQQMWPLSVGEIAMVMSDIPNGKALAKCYLIESSGLYTLNQRICWLKPTEIISKFLFFLLNRNRYFLEFDSKVTQTNLRKDEVLSCPLRFPYKKEQQKIAVFLSSVNTKIEKLDKKKALLEQYKRGVMQKLFGQEIRFKDEQRDDYPDWVEKQLSEAAKFRRGSFPQPYGLEKWYDDVSGAPFVQVFDVADNFRLKPDTKRKISEEAQSKSVYAKKGSLVLTIQGSIGRIAITQFDAYIDRTLLIFTSFLLNVNIKYFAYSVFLLFEREKVKAPGGIIKTITKERLSSFELLLPGIREQQKIANFLSAIDQKIELTCTEIQKAKTFRKGLLQQMFV